MSQRELYVAKMEEQFAAWRAKLEAMKARVEEAELEGRLEVHKQIEASQQQHEVACRHLDELKQSGEEAWGALKAGIDTVWKELNPSSTDGDSD